MNEDCRLSLLGKNTSKAMKLIQVQDENILPIDSIVSEENPVLSGLKMQKK